MDAQDSKGVPSRAANTVKVFGAVRVRSVREFISVCVRKGVPMKLLSCFSIQRKGYRSKLFDSRHFEIRLATVDDTILLDRSLRWAQENVAEMKHWRHELTYTHTAPVGKNRFLPLRDLCRETRELKDEILVCCWNINTTRGKSREIREFLSRNNIDVLGLVETSGDSDCLNDQVPGFTWFGRAKTRRAGGVGFLVNETILDHCRVKTHNGRTADTIFLHICPENSRSTLFMLVYGKAAASREESLRQWSGYERDLRAQLKLCQDDTDVVFLGDINARMGRAVNAEESQHISTCGETIRNISGEEALSFLQRTDLVCLNNRLKNQISPHYTYREKGKRGQSVIDVICTSRGMYARGLAAEVLPDTLTTRESHFPVVAPIRWHRRRPRPRYIPKKKIWDLKKLKAPEARERFQASYNTALQSYQFKPTVTENVSTLRHALKQSGEEVIGKISVGGKPRKSKEERRTANAGAELRNYRKRNQPQIADGSEAHIEEEKRLVGIVQSLRKDQKFKRHKRLARKLVAQQREGNVRGTMRTVNAFNDSVTHQSSMISCVADSSHRIQTSTRAILNAFEDHWGPRLKNPNFSAEMKEIDLDGLANADHSPLCDVPVTPEELEAALGTLEFHKAQGLDELPPSFFMQPTPQLKSFLLQLFNQVLADADFPTEWKTDKRIPIHKSGRKTDVDKYRLLAINSVYRKLFCTILKRRIESIIALDDAQNGFRKNRRASDNIALVQGIIQEATRKHGTKAQLLIADFSKAFDTCNIPILLKKLAKYGCRGNMLRVIADMYTNASTRIFVNGVLGKRMEVTNGVAQGCVLSPLFFAIYIDELLVKFRESGLGIPIGRLVQNAMSFADDLILASPDTDTSQRYIEILSRWCSDNKLAINVGKSGVFRCDRSLPIESQRLYMNDQPLQFLDEEDSEFEKRRKFEYLGVTFDGHGSWNSFLDLQIAKVRRALGRNYAFFHDAPVPIKLKLKTAHMIVLSLATYCADVSHTTRQKEDQIDAVQARVLKAILHLPKSTSHAKIRHIIGQPRLSSARLRARVSNFIRIQRLPSDTRLRQILDAGTWGKSSRFFGRYDKDLKKVYRQQKLSSVSEEELHDVLKNGNALKVRTFLKKVTSQADIFENAHFELRMKHPLFLTLSPSLDNPIWQKTAYEVGAYLRWVTGTARLGSLRHVEPDLHICEHCGLDILSSLEEHCLLRCKYNGAPETRAEFLRELREKMPVASEHFSNLSDTGKLWWLLTGGRNNASPRPKVNSLRVQPLRSPFVAGDSVPPINGMKDPLTNWISYEHFKEIECKHINDIQIYTDGSAPEGFAGIGVVIFMPGETEPIHCASVEIGRTSNNVAELEAIHYALEWVLEHHESVNKSAVPLRIYTDSQYSRDTLLNSIPAGKNFLLVESIFDLGNRLRLDFEVLVTIHWIPSHIEQTIGGWRPIFGNRKADKLAEQARDRSKEEHTERQVSVRRARVGEIIYRFLKDIEIVFKTSQDRKEKDGPSVDDFVTDASQEFSSASSDT